MLRRLLPILLTVATLFFLRAPAVTAFSIIPDTQCGGVFTCTINQRVCRDIDGNICLEGTLGCLSENCQTETSTESRSCQSIGPDCRINNTGCNGGNDAGTQCSFTPNGGGGGGPSYVCGNGACETALGENQNNCPDDCYVPGPGDPPDPPPPSGSCFQSCRVASNCGEFGEVAGVGTCQPGELCCQEKPPDAVSCNCCDDGDWVSQAGNPEPGFDSCIVPAHWDTGYYAGVAGECARCACTPICTVNCGQADACGGNCPSTDAGTPNVRDIVPPNGGVVFLNDDDTSVTVSWTTNNKPEYVQIQLYPEGSDCVAHPTYCFSAYKGSATYDNRQFTFVPYVGAGNRYTFRIRGVNTTCGTQRQNWVESTFSIYAYLRGNIYADDGSGSCSSSTLTWPGSGGSIYATDGVSGWAGLFPTMGEHETAVPYSPGAFIYELVMNPGQDGGTPLECVCPGDCRYSNLSAPSLSNLDYWISEEDLNEDGWFQTTGGLVYANEPAGNTALRDPIAVVTCAAAPLCEPFISLQGSPGVEESAGLIITAGGEVDSSGEDGVQTDQITNRSDQLLAIDSQLDGPREDSRYFKQLFGLGISPTDNSTDFGSFVDSDAQKPGTPREYYYVPGSMTISDTWSVAAGESYTIFIDGDLLIEDPSGAEQLIDVEEGGFLAFIVAGNIDFDRTVGNSALDSTIANVEGIYVADGTLTVETYAAAGGGDLRFVGEGSFVGWSGVDLQRDYNDGSGRKVENNTRPVESFVFRPDLVLNAPESFSYPRTVWRETL